MGLQTWILELGTNYALDSYFPKQTSDFPGIQFLSLSQLEENERTKKALYQIIREGVLDSPGESDFEDYDLFCKTIFPIYQRNAKTTFLATAEGAVIGLSTFALETNDVANCGLTIVTKAYRGHRIGKMLKKLCIGYCLDHQVKTMVTKIDEENRAMQKICKTFGFVKKD